MSACIDGEAHYYQPDNRKADNLPEGTQRKTKEKDKKDKLECHGVFLVYFRFLCASDLRWEKVVTVGVLRLVSLTVAHDNSPHRLAPHVRSIDFLFHEVDIRWGSVARSHTFQNTVQYMQLVGVIPFTPLLVLLVG